VSLSVWAARTNHHKLGDLNNRNVFLTVLEAGKSKVKMPAQSGSNEDPVPGFWMTVFLLCPHMESSERGRKPHPSLVIRH